MIKGQTGVFYTDSFSAAGSSHRPYTYTIAKPFYPSGVQKQVPAGMAASWRLCYTGSYDYSLEAEFFAELAVECNATYMMLACASQAGADFYNLAAGETSAVLGDGISTNNGVQWYYSGQAWGFADPADELALDSCDGDDGDLRTCWYANQEKGGYRCGNVTGLNDDSTWQRYIFVSDFAAGASAIDEYELLPNGTLLGTVYLHFKIIRNCC